MTIGSWRNESLEHTRYLYIEHSGYALKHEHNSSSSVTISEGA